MKMAVIKRRYFHNKVFIAIWCYGIITLIPGKLLTDSIFSEVIAQNDSPSPFRLVPYHSLLSAMFQPVSKRRTLQSKSYDSFYDDNPPRRLRGPYPRYDRRYYRKRPIGIRYSKTNNKWRKYPTHHKFSFRTTKKPFIPGGIEN